MAKKKEKVLDKQELKKDNKVQADNFELILKHIGDRNFRNTTKLKDYSQDIYKHYQNMYQYDLIELLFYDLYIPLILMYHKEITKQSFCCLLGMSRHVFDNDGRLSEMLNDKRTDMNKKIENAKQHYFNLRMANSDNAILKMAYANKHMGYAENTQRDSDIHLTISSSDLKQSLLGMKKE